MHFHGFDNNFSQSHVLRPLTPIPNLHLHVHISQLDPSFPCPSCVCTHTTCRSHTQIKASRTTCDPELCTIASCKTCTAFTETEPRDSALDSACPIGNCGFMFS